MTVIPRKTARHRTGARDLRSGDRRSARTRWSTSTSHGRLSPELPYIAGGCVVLALARPPRGPLAAAVRRPGDPALRDAAQRAGLAMIHRIDLINTPPAERRPAATDLDHARGDHVHPGGGWCCATTDRCSATPTPSGWPASCCCCCRWCRASAPRSSARGSGSRSGPYSFQPAEAAKVLLAIAFAAYLVEKRDVLALAGYRILGIDLPRARDLGPDPGDVADQPGHPGVPARPRHLAAVLRAVRDDALRLDRTGRLGRAGHPAVRRRGVLRPTSTWATSGSGWAPGWTRSPTTTRTSR